MPHEIFNAEEDNRNVVNNLNNIHILVLLLHDDILQPLLVLLLPLVVGADDEGDGGDADHEE